MECEEEYTTDEGKTKKQGEKCEEIFRRASKTSRTPDKNEKTNEEKNR